MVEATSPQTGTERPQERVHWITHRKGRPAEAADKSYTYLHSKNFGWTISQIEKRMGRGDPDAPDSAAEIFIAEYLARGVEPWREASFRTYLWQQVRRVCTDRYRARAKLRLLREADLSDHDHQTFHNTASHAEETPAEIASALEAAQPVDAALHAIETPDEDPEVLEFIVDGAAEGVGLIIFHFSQLNREAPRLTASEATQIYLRTQDLSSKDIAALMSLRSVDSERTNWYRLRKKVRDLYSVDLEEMVKSAKPANRRRK